MFRLFRKKTEMLNRVIPRHIGIIMDGNGRWARRRGLPRSAGHRAGAQTLRRIVEYSSEIGVECLTVYAFSTENWKRPQDEVDALMALLLDYLKDYKNQLAGDSARIRVIGDRAPFSEAIRRQMEVVEQYSAQNDKITVNIALNYGGRAEIVRSARRAAELVASGAIQAKDVDEETMERELYTADSPPLDLIIRPSGEKRLSNFLLWQSAYAELWFDDVLWPDFRPADLDRAIDDFNRRDRRYGGV